MSKRAKASSVDWINVPHARIRHAVLDSPAWRVLSHTAKALYTDLRATLRQTNNGNIDCTLSRMKHRGWTAPATLSKCLQQLERMGFIATTRRGGIAALSKRCSLYRFTDLQVYEHPKQGVEAQPATFDYQRFESVKDAETAIQEFEKERERRRQQRRKNKTKLQKLKLSDTKIEAMSPHKASKFEQEDTSKLQNLNKRNQAETRATAGGKRK